LIISTFVSSDSLNLKTNSNIFSLEIDSAISLNGPSKNDFKGHVSLDQFGRGIIITAINGQNDKLLKLVSEKIDLNTYLIDYRLMRTCDFNIKLQLQAFQKDLRFGFSPRSLENKAKTDKFDVEVEILNFYNFLPKNLLPINEKTVKNLLAGQCEKKKGNNKELKEKA